VTDFLTTLQTHFGAEFTMERELSGGGMSRVVLALDAKLQRRVVIKVLPPSVTATISAERFEREIMLSAALQHPNIVPVLRSGDVDGLPYFVMPYIDGESLRTRMARGPLSVRETVHLLRDVTRALVFAHGRGVVHRDIKPDNVLLSAGTAVVVDFGVAKALSVSQQSGARANSPTITGIGMSPGTPAYMAPEQAAADPATDHRADLYSLGILAYEMLVGAPPFHGRTPQALLAAQLSERPQPLSVRRYDVPKALAELINGCLEKDPNRRPESAQAVLRALEGHAITSGVYEAPKGASRRSRSLLVKVAVWAAVVAVAAWGFFAPRGDKAASAPPGPATSVAASPAPIRSISVLPLDGIGQDSRAGAVAAGITSELASSMLGIAGLRVSSPVSAVAARARLASATDSGRAPGVDLLLEGSVQRERSVLRVTIRLVSASADSLLWAQTFDGVTDSTLALQTRVVSAVRAAVVAK
jgi:serine/threonine-protein kinase